LSLSTAAASVTGTLAVSSGLTAATAALSGTISSGGDAGSLTIKQASTNYTNGIYLERGGERNGYYMYIGGGADALTFRRNYFGVQSDVMSLTREANVGIGTAAPAHKLQVAGAIVNQTDVGGTGDAGFQIASGQRLGFDDSGVRSWNVKATGGNLTFTSGDLNGQFQVLTPFAVAQGVKFPATQFSSADANTLDDYEEGTFTPTIVGSTTAGTATYSTQLARYTKIGRQVSCQIDLGYNSGTGTGNLTIAGLPFTDAGLNNPAVTIGYLDGITLTALNYAMAYLASGTTRIDFVQIPTGGGALTSVAYDAEGRIILNVTYTA
jgi:hypothetical protein